MKEYSVMSEIVFESQYGGSQSRYEIDVSYAYTLDDYEKYKFKYILDLSLQLAIYRGYTEIVHWVEKQINELSDDLTS